jgi:DNA-binding transcriptional ArsR family regulator
MATTNTTEEAYADGTALTNVIGDHSKAKILAVMLGDHTQDLTASDIARMAGIERSTFYDHIDTLLDYGLIKITREAGNSTMYQINKDSEPAQAIAEFEWKLLDQVNKDGEPDARVDERDE